MDLLAPGGSLFIGDVRNHTLQGAFHTAVALARTATTDTDEIRQRIRRAMVGEPELLLAPEFFATWAADHQPAAGIEIHVKRGSADTEMNRYRYDVIVHKTPAPVRSLASTPTWTWTECAGAGGFDTRLTSERPAAVRIVEIPRAGLITDVHIEQALAAGLPLADALAQASAAEPPDTVTPEQLHRLGEAIGYRVAVTWGARPGTLDAVFITANDAELQRIPRLTDLYLATTEARERVAHANDPRNNTRISAVRQRLSARLPDYMLPTQIVVLEEIPMTSSGKIDRKALPAPVFADTPFRAPQNLTEEILAGIYAQVLGLERVGVDESFFDLGGDSILSMQVVARARAAGLVCKPRDIFVEQTVAGLARVVEVAGGAAGPVDEGVGDVVATPIMRWLHSVDGPVDQFNQTMVVHAPAGVSQADVAVVLQALLDRHAMLRLRVDDSADDWSLTVPEAGSVDAASCLRAVDVLSDEALIAARSRLNPADGVMLSALWVPSTGQLALIIHHLAVDAVSWRILLEDLNIAWAQHHSGQPVALPPAGTSFARWASLLADHAHAPAVVDQADTWRQVLATSPALPAVHPELDTYAGAGHLSVSLDTDTTRLLLGEVPAAFHAGIHDILLIAYGLAWTEFLGTRGAPIGIDVEGHGRHDDLSPDVDLSRTVGWFTTKYPVSLAMGGLRWTQVVTGDAALGAVIKDAKEQLRALPDGLTYGLLRYLNPEVELAGPDPTIGFNYLGRLGAAADLGPMGCGGSARTACRSPVRPQRCPCH